VEIAVKAGQIQQEEAALIVVNLFQGVKTPGGATGVVDKVLGGLITELIASGDFTGKLNELAVLYTQGAIPAKRVMVVGLGKEEEFDLDKVRDAAGTVAKRVRQLGVKSYSTIVHGGGKAGLSAEMASQAIAEGTILALYRFLAHRSASQEAETEIEQLTFVEFDANKLPQVEAGARVGQVSAESACLVRDLVNHPPNVATPTMLAQTARPLAEEHGQLVQLACKVAADDQIGDQPTQGFVNGPSGSARCLDALEEVDHDQFCLFLLDLPRFDCYFHVSSSFFICYLCLVPYSNLCASLWRHSAATGDMSPAGSRRQLPGRGFRR